MIALFLNLMPHYAIGRFADIVLVLVTFTIGHGNKYELGMYILENHFLTFMILKLLWVEAFFYYTVQTQSLSDRLTNIVYEMNVSYLQSHIFAEFIL